MGGGAACGLASVLLLASPAAAPTPVRYAIYPVRAAFADDYGVGSLGKGLACIKAGSLRWSAFAWRGDRAAVDIANALIERGVEATAVDPVLGDPHATAKASIEVTSLQVDACRPRYGMLKLGNVGLKGGGTMTVRWRVADAGGTVVVDKITSAPFTFSARDSSLGTILSAGLVANSDEIAPTLPR